MKRAQFADQMSPIFREIFFMNLGERESQYTKLFNIQSENNRQYVDDSYTSGFGLVSKKTEGTQVSTDDAIQGLDTRYTFDTYALGWNITEEAMEDDLSGIFKKMPQAAGRSMRITRETDGANMYNNGFDGTNFADGADGKELFATDHLLLDGSTQKNELSTAANLTATSLEQALIDIAATTDDRGLLAYLQPRKLIVAPSNEWVAKILLQSSQDPDSANNAINPAKDTGLELVVNHFLTDANAWFILCDNHELNWIDRVKPEFKEMNGGEFETGNLKYKVRARWKRGWSLPWGAFGSPGV
jgi:phage major head subunit gpT-like protein